MHGLTPTLTDQQRAVLDDGERDLYDNLTKSSIDDDATRDLLVSLATARLQAREGLPCDCCVKGKTLSGLPCICGGSGLQSDEVIGLRQALDFARRLREEAERACGEMREVLSDASELHGTDEQILRWTARRAYALSSTVGRGFERRDDVVKEIDAMVEGIPIARGWTADDVIDAVRAGLRALKGKNDSNAPAGAEGEK